MRTFHQDAINGADRVVDHLCDLSVRGPGRVVRLQTLCAVHPYKIKRIDSVYVFLNRASIKHAVASAAGLTDNIHPDNSEFLLRSLSRCMLADLVQFSTPEVATVARVLRSLQSITEANA